MTARKTRTRISASLVAFATLAGVALAASPAQAIEPDSPEGAIVLPNSSTGEISERLRGFCHMKTMNDPMQVDFKVLKTDPTGAPIRGVTFEIEFQPNSASSNAVSLDSWESVRSPELESTRVDAEHMLYNADMAVSDYRAETYSPASNALSSAKGDLSAAQDVYDRNPTPENQAAVTAAEVGVSDAQVALDEVQPEMDRLVAAAADTRTAAVAAAQAISDHLMSTAEIDTFTVTTDANGAIVVPTYYCSGAGDASGDRWVITETAVPTGVDPEGIGSEIVLSTGYGNHAESVVSGLDGDVYQSADFVEESPYTGSWTIKAENALLPEPTPTPTPEEPTPIPEEPTAPAPTPVKEVLATPSSPIQPPIVSG